MMSTGKPWRAAFGALVLASCASAQTPGSSPPACAPLGLAGDTLAAWRAGGFETAEPDRAARELAACLEAPDAALRDGIGYEGLAALLRGGAVSEAARLDLIGTLSARLEAPDPDGFGRPFAALALAELARTDRVEAFLTVEQRSGLVRAAAGYLSGVTDYRGFDEEDGWRHGVAHGADFALQLALNPAIGADGLGRLRDALGSQAAARDGHAYVFGEPERLARALLVIASREAFDSDDWEAWFISLADPAPLADWNEAFGSEAALARLHNLKAFAHALYVPASLSENPVYMPVRDGAFGLLNALP